MSLFLYTILKKPALIGFMIFIIWELDQRY